MDFFSRGLQAEYKNKGIIIQVKFIPLRKTHIFNIDITVVINANFIGLQAKKTRF